jgi:aldehyde:ferredoxin oxidoreductase
MIIGRSEKPCYLKITDECVEICDAADLWGKDTHQTTDELVNKHNGNTGKCGIWAIGQAGENLVKIAQATVDNYNSLDRNVGAVMGSKNLKAVVILRSKGLKVYDRKRFLKLYSDKFKNILAHPHYQPRMKLDHEMLQQFFDTTAMNIKVCVGCLGACRSAHEAREGQYK